LTHKKDVGQDTAQHAGLDNSDFALLERNDRDLLRLVNVAAQWMRTEAYNEFDGISKCRIHQTTKSLTKLGG